MQIIYQQISGPFGWPNYENTKDKLPTTSGLYLTTFETNDGFIPWGLGVTSRPVRVRFLEHSRNFKNGEYNILNVQTAISGQRQIEWKGWGWTEEKRKKYANIKNNVTGSAEEQFLATYIFIVNLPKSIRLERLESALTDYFHASGNSLIDQGMQLSRRWEVEEKILVKFDTFHKVISLPNQIEI